MHEVRLIPDLTKRQREHEEKVRTGIGNRNKALEEAGDFSHHWRMVGPRGARSMVKAPGRAEPVEENRRKRPRDQDSRSGLTPPANRQALSH